jgi:nitrite reductase/ring-hydroxylating ferredoxin subunit
LITSRFRKVNDRKVNNVENVNSVNNVNKLNEESMPQRIDLCGTAEVVPGNALKVETGNLVLAVFNVDGEFFVMDDLCSHGPGSLSEGYIDGDVVECNFHNGQFNIKTGEVAAPPCMVPMKTYKTMVENGRVIIETE